jgi:hypothetical protein
MQLNHGSRSVGQKVADPLGRGGIGGLRTDAANRSSNRAHQQHVLPDLHCIRQLERAAVHGKLDQSAGLDKNPAPVGCAHRLARPKSFCESAERASESHQFEHGNADLLAASRDGWMLPTRISMCLLLA